MDGILSSIKKKKRKTKVDENKNFHFVENKLNEEIIDKSFYFHCTNLIGTHFYQKILDKFKSTNRIYIAIGPIGCGKEIIFRYYFSINNLSYDTFEARCEFSNNIPQEIEQFIFYDDGPKIIHVYPYFFSQKEHFIERSFPKNFGKFLDKLESNSNNTLIFLIDENPDNHVIEKEINNEIQDKSKFEFIRFPKLKFGDCRYVINKIKDSNKDKFIPDITKLHFEPNIFNLKQNLIYKKLTYSKDEENSCSFYHTLGKFLYNKRIHPKTGVVTKFDKSELLQFEHKPKLYFDPNFILKKFDLQSLQVFRGFLVENSYGFFKEISEFSKAFEIFSFSEYLDKYSFQLDSLRYESTLMSALGVTTFNLSQYNGCNKKNKTKIKSLENKQPKNKGIFNFIKPVYGSIHQEEIKKFRELTDEEAKIDINLFHRTGKNKHLEFQELKQIYLAMESKEKRVLSEIYPINKNSYNDNRNSLRNAPKRPFFTSNLKNDINSENFFQKKSSYNIFNDNLEKENLDFRKNSNNLRNNEVKNKNYYASKLKSSNPTDSTDKTNNKNDRLIMPDGHPAEDEIFKLLQDY